MIKARANEHRPDTMTIVYTIHNFGLIRGQVGAIAARISAESSVAAQSPHRTTVLAVGDFNYSETAAMHLHVPEIDKGLVHPPRQREFGD
eukprot:7670006-Pyramimonas_sp.AAC.1